MTTEGEDSFFCALCVLEGKDRGEGENQPACSTEYRVDAVFYAWAITDGESNHERCTAIAKSGLASSRLDPEPCSFSDSGLHVHSYCKNTRSSIKAGRGGQREYKTRCHQATTKYYVLRTPDQCRGAKSVLQISVRMTDTVASATVRNGGNGVACERTALSLFVFSPRRPVLGFPAASRPKAQTTHPLLVT